MYTREQTYTKIVSIINELFEVPIDDINPESRLFDDLDLDSIDAVDLIVGLQEYVGKRLEPEQFKEVRTVNDVVDAAMRVLEELKHSGQDPVMDGQ